MAAVYRTGSCSAHRTKATALFVYSVSCAKIQKKMFVPRRRRIALLKPALEFRRANKTDAGGSWPQYVQASWCTGRPIEENSRSSAVHHAEPEAEAGRIRISSQNHEIQHPYVHRVAMVGQELRGADVTELVSAIDRGECRIQRVSHCLREFHCSRLACEQAHVHRLDRRGTRRV